jgi:hypothetical protein
MNKFKILALLAAVALFALVPIGLYAQQPEAPHKFYGTATLADGSLAPDDTTVAANVDGVEIATAAVESSFQEGYYVLTVGPEAGETFTGQTVTFSVDGVATDDSVPWQTRGAQELNLVATVATGEVETPVVETPVVETPVVETPAAEVDVDALTAAIKFALMGDAEFRAELKGEAGSAGSDGSDGSDGADGRSGAPGDAGSQGAPGSQGNRGTDGTDGTSGSAGSQGPQGLPGADGSDGGGALGVVALILAIVALLGVGGAFAMSRKS